MRWSSSGPDTMLGIMLSHPSMVQGVLRASLSSSAGPVRVLTGATWTGSGPDAGPAQEVSGDGSA